MGYMRHHAIVVTSSAPELIKAAYTRAVELGMSVTGMTPEVINGYSSFLVAPDGSKEGWAESDAGDLRRDQFTAWLDGQRYADDSTSLGWVEVQFDDDEHETAIVRDSDEHSRRRYGEPRYNIGGRNSPVDVTLAHSGAEHELAYYADENGLSSPVSTPAIQPPAGGGDRAAADPTATALAAFRAWLDRNGDIPCTCGHAYRWHLADLSGCADCVALEPVHSRCTGWNLDRAAMERAR